MSLKRVVVTGVGALTPIGNNVNDFWGGLISGQSGSAAISHFDASKFKTRFGCELKNFNAIDFIDKKEIRKYDNYTIYSLVSTQEALINSGIDLDNINKDNVGVIWGSGIGGINTFSKEIEGFVLGDGTPRFSPFFIPKMIADIAAGIISIKYGFRGPNFATVSACASSANAIIDAFNYIRLGHASVFVCGGSEASITPAGVGGFNALKALSTNNSDPSRASRPFDVDRDGFVLGEGSGTLVLEEYEHAKQRNANILAEIVGGGLSADAHHITAPHPDGVGAGMVMNRALSDASISAKNIDYINVHGTSTGLGDIAEIKAIKSVFKNEVYRLNISSSKSMTGHLLGAAGAIESIACILAMKYNKIPPTINLMNLDPLLDDKINYTPNHCQEKNVTYAMCNTFGFGGHNASIIFRKHESK